MPLCIKNRPPVLFPLRKPGFRPRRVITIAPETTLGGFIKGTMNFTAEAANRWFDMGYMDAKAVIKREREVLAIPEGVIGKVLDPPNGVADNGE